jgi:hypothetical protein
MDDQTTALADETPVVEAEGQEPQVEQPVDADAEAAPEADAKPKRSKTAREALERAFAADKPEATAKEGGDKAKPETKVAEAPKDGPARTEDGKFAPKAEAKPDAKETEAKPTGKGLEEPPSRFSPDAKADWAKAPESVRAEAQRAVREMEQGIQEKDAQIAPLKPFFELAQKHGVKLESALERYVNLENMLRDNPTQGFATIAQNMGLTPQQVGRMLMGQAPGQPDARDQQVMQLRAELAELKQGYGRVSQTMQEQQQTAVLSQVEQFAAQNPRFDELSGEIVRMLETGYAANLQDAYEKAARLNPAPAPQPTAAPSAPAQTRMPQSLTGAPSTGSNPASNRAPSKTPREALERAFRS